MRKRKRKRNTKKATRRPERIGGLPRNREKSLLHNLLTSSKVCTSPRRHNRSTSHQLDGVTDQDQDPDLLHPGTDHVLDLPDLLDIFDLHGLQDLFLHRSGDLLATTFLNNQFTVTQLVQQT